MARRHHYKRRTKPTYDIDITTFLNLMVVLVPFLLITAVFSRLTIVELNLPSSAGGALGGSAMFPAYGVPYLGASAAAVPFYSNVGQRYLQGAVTPELLQKIAPLLAKGAQSEVDQSGFFPVSP